MSKWVLGVIGGSGLYAIDGLEARREERIETPWGDPSDTLVRGRIGDVELVFLPRHGRGHRLSPTQVPYRANIDALKRAGVTDIVSISACGSLQEQYAPGHFVTVDQFIDRTFAREKSFFGAGMVAHVSMAHPVCARLSGLIGDAAEAAGAALHRGGTYLVMEGPQFSSYAESQMYRQWGCDVIGMTNMPEAKLAREAELPYATLAMVTDYDCWREESENVSVTNVLEIMHANSALARKAIVKLAEALSEKPRAPSPDGIETCLDYAHVSMAHPVCARLSGLIGDAAEAAGAALHRGGTYLVMEGPQFSSYAESQMYRQWGCDVIGMTNMPEAKLAREAELPYATLAMVTDYDCWREESENVSVTNVLEIMHANSALARKAIVKLAEALSEKPRAPSPDGIETCLDYALITAPEARDPALLANLDAVAGRVL